MKRPLILKTNIQLETGKTFTFISNEFNLTYPFAAKTQLRFLALILLSAWSKRFFQSSSILPQFFAEHEQRNCHHILFQGLKNSSHPPSCDSFKDFASCYLFWLNCNHLGTVSWVGLIASFSLVWVRHATHHSADKLPYIFTYSCFLFLAPLC